MTRTLHVAAVLVFCLLALPSPVLAWLGTNRPVGIIDTTSYSGAAGAWATGNQISHDVTAGVVTKWKTLATWSAWIGAAHSGQTGLNQADANARVTSIALWRWLDTDGDLAADADDARTRGTKTTKWTKVSEILPSTVSGNVVGWEVATGAPDTASAYGDIQQSSGAGTTIARAENVSALYIIRVVNTSGDTNLFDAAGGTEQWDNGDTSDGIGSDVPGDKYVDASGNTPGTADGRINGDAVSSDYRPKAS